MPDEAPVTMIVRNSVIPPIVDVRDLPSAKNPSHIRRKIDNDGKETTESARVPESNAPGSIQNAAQDRCAEAHLYDALGHFNDDDGWAMASHLSISALMALFPFLIFATTLASFLGANPSPTTRVHIVFDTWPTRSPSRSRARW